MINKFKTVGFSFERVPIELRERLAMDETAASNLLKAFKQFTAIKEALILSTCNRTEIYYSAEADQSVEIVKLMAIESAIQDSESLMQYCDVYNNQRSAVNRLFEVATGLHSKVLGDLQISHQIKTAYQLSTEQDMAGPFLHRLMHTIFFANKRIVRETAFRDGAASVSYATLELTEQLVSTLTDPKILIVGLGKIGTDVCQHFAKSRFKDQVQVSNRSMSKARDLAAANGFTAISLDQIPAALPAVDVVISALSVKQPLITRTEVEKQKILSYKYFIDLSVPRSIDADIEEIPGALVYNIDNIETKTSQSLKERKAAIPQVKQILAESIAEFNQWSKEMEVFPTLGNLKKALEKIRQEEVAKAIKKGHDLDLDTIEQITKSIIQRIIKRPALTLRSACKRDQADSLVEGLVDLFDLEKESTPK